jgi:hypothetical protein
MDNSEIARARAIPLTTVLEALGAERDPKDPTRNWRAGASRITVTDSQFYDHNQAGASHRIQGRAGGGGAIDLVQYLKDVDFRGAVRELGAIQSHGRSTSTATASASAQTPANTRPLPEPAPDRQSRAQWYLTEVRAIPAAIVDDALKAGGVFADTKGNVVFRLRNEAGQEIGYEVRGTYGKPYHSVHGEKGMFIHKVDNQRIASFVESGIEALSYQANGGVGLIISTTGSAVEMPSRMAVALKVRGYDVVTAFNADKAGDRMAERLSEQVGSALRRDRPPTQYGKDWNDALQSGYTRATEVPAPQEATPPGSRPPRDPVIEDPIGPSR